MRRIVGIALCAIMTVSFIAAMSPSEVVDAKLRAGNFVGVATARNGTYDNLLYNKGHGTLDFRNSIPMPTNALFPVASNTKLYTAIALYQLQERGVINLENRIQDHLDATDFANFGLPLMTSYCPVVQNDPTNTCQNITFVQLLSMQSCIPNDGFSLFFGQYPGSQGLVLGQYLQFPLRCKPGNTFYYSNPAYIFAGYFVEKFSGMTLRQYFTENINKPLGQKDTYLNVFNGAYLADHRRVDEWLSYVDPTSGFEVSRGKCHPEYNLGDTGGAGAMMSTADDEAKLYFALFNFGGSGAPLFKHYETVLALVKPRVYTWPMPGTSLNNYFAQGILVAATNLTGAIEYVVYKGGLVCVDTQNTFRVATRDPSTGAVISPAVMTQAYTAVPVVVATLAEVQAADMSGNQSVSDFAGSKPNRGAEMVGRLAWDIMEAFF